MITLSFPWRTWRTHTITFRIRDRRHKCVLHQELCGWILLQNYFLLNTVILSLLHLAHNPPNSPPPPTILLPKLQSTIQKESFCLASHTIFTVPWIFPFYILLYPAVIWNKVLVSQINVSYQQLYNTLGIDDMRLFKIQPINTNLSNNNCIFYFKMQNYFPFWRKFNFETHSREYCLFCRLLNFLYRLKAYNISRGSSECVWKGDS